MNFVHLHHHKTSLHSFCSMYYLWSFKGVRYKSSSR